MAIGWLSLLKTVPWGEVIANAPAVADGAKKLWSKVGRKPSPGAGEAAAATTADDPLALLLARLDALEASAAEQHQQLLESSDLIRALAEQQQELVRRVEAHRVRWIALTVALGLTAAAALAALALVLAR